MNIIKILRFLAVGVFVTMLLILSVLVLAVTLAIIGMVIIHVPYGWMIASGVVLFIFGLVVFAGTMWREYYSGNN